MNTENNPLTECSQIITTLQKFPLKSKTKQTGKKQTKKTFPPHPLQYPKKICELYTLEFYRII